MKRKQSLIFQGNGIHLKPITSAGALFIIIAISCTGRASVEKGDNVAQLKAFLSERPPIELAVIYNKNDLSGNPVNRPYVTYQGARQEENFYIRELLVDQDENEPFSTNTTIAAGRGDLVAWRATHAGSKGLFATERTAFGASEVASPPSIHSTNQLIQAIAVYDSALFRFLDLGLIDVKRGTLHFEGNKFQYALNRGADAQGEIESKDNRVVALKFKINSGTASFVSEFEYTSNPAVPPFLPTRVTQKVFDENGALKRTSLIYQFMRFKLAETALPLRHFLPDRFTNASSSIQIRLTNGIFFQQIPGGQLVKITAGQTAASPTLRRIIFLLIILITLVGPVLLLTKNKNKNI